MGDFLNLFYQNLSEILRLEPLLADNGLYSISSVGLENKAIRWNKQLPQRSLTKIDFRFQFLIKLLPYVCSKLENVQYDLGEPMECEMF